MPRHILSRSGLRAVSFERGSGSFALIDSLSTMSLPLSIFLNSFFGASGGEKKGMLSCRSYTLTKFIIGYRRCHVHTLGDVDSSLLAELGVVKDGVAALDFEVLR